MWHALNPQLLPSDEGFASLSRSPVSGIFHYVQHRVEVCLLGKFSKRGNQCPADSAVHVSHLGCDHNPLLPSRKEQINARGGIRLTEMSDARLFVGGFRSLLLPSADNASAGPIPDQTARQRVLMVRPAEADQDPEAVDGCLVCSCCSPGYA